MSKSIHYLFAIIILACLNLAVSAEEPGLYTFENPNVSIPSEDVTDQGPILRFTAKTQEMSLVTRLPDSNLSILVSTHGDNSMDQIEPEQVTKEMSRMILPLASAMLSRGIEKPNPTGDSPNLSVAGGEFLITTEGADLDISMLLSPKSPLGKPVSGVPVKKDGVVSGSCDCYRCQCDAANCADFCELCWSFVEALKGAE